MTPTRFLPMKTPLGSEILENWNLEEPPRHPLSISILQQQLHDKHIGMIIDLSNHDSLYGADLRETGIQYERVPVRSCLLNFFQTRADVLSVHKLNIQPFLFLAFPCGTANVVEKLLLLNARRAMFHSDRNKVRDCGLL